MKAIALLFLLNCSTIKAGVSGNNQAYVKKIYCAFQSINNDIFKKNGTTADTIMNTISPEIISLMYMIFNDDIKDIQSKEGIKTDSFPSYQYDIRNSFEKFELSELKPKYLPTSKYITFFSKTCK